VTKHKNNPKHNIAMIKAFVNQWR